MPEAWLLDVYPHPRRSALVVWIKHGDQTHKRIVPYYPDFCIQADAEGLEAAEAILADDPRVAKHWRSRKAVWLRGPKQEVLRIRPKRFQDIHAVATDLRKATKSKGFLFYDVDHQPESRWMHAMGIWSMCRLAVEAGRDGPKVCWPLRVAPGEDRFTVDYPDPGLKRLPLAVHADSGATRELGDPLVAISLGDETITCDVPGDDDAERACLVAFGKRLRSLDPDVLLTKHGDRFDIPFLLRRISRLGLRSQVWLGRDADVDPEHPDQQSKSLHTYGRWLFKTHAYYLRGRWHIDLSKKTLDSEDDRRDIHGIVYLARVSNRRPQDVNRNGAGYALQQMQIDLATDLGAALPWKRNLAEDWKDAATLCAVDRGGQIMVPTPGIYDDVAACDFSGYYPSLIVRHNLSSDSINCQCCPDGPIIPELNYHTCEADKPVTGRLGHQAYILHRLAPHRKWAKAVLKRAKTVKTAAPT